MELGIPPPRDEFDPPVSGSLHGALPPLTPHRLTVVTSGTALREQVNAVMEYIELLRTRYGDSYPDPRAYDPHYHLQALAAGYREYFLLESSQPSASPLGAGVNARFDTPGVFEVCGLISHPQYGRGMGFTVVEAMMSILEQSHALEASYAQSVTGHHRSQRVFDRLGFSPVGVSVLDWPDMFSVGQRDGSVIMYKIFDDHVRDPRAVYSTPALIPILDHVYGMLGCTRMFTGADTPVLGGGVDVDDAALHTELAGTILMSPMSDPAAAVLAADRLEQRGAIHVTVAMDLQHPHAMFQSSELLGAGFFFKAIMPSGTGERLLLQRLRSGEVLDEGKLALLPSSRALWDTVKRVHAAELRNILSSHTP
jgi:hypothetical protein